MNCSQTKNSLSAYVDGELFGPEAAAVAAHVEACPSCQLEFNELTQIKDMLSLLPAVPAPAGLRAGVMLGLQQAALLQAAEAGLALEPVAPALEPEPRPAARLRFGWKASVAAAAVAALAFTWSLRIGPMLSPLVADGQPGSHTAPGLQPGETPDPGPDTGPTEPAGNEQPADRPGVVDEPNPTDVAKEPGAGTPGDQPAQGTEVADGDLNSPSDNSLILHEPDTTPPPLNDNRVATANVNDLASDRLVASTMQVSLLVADPDTYAASLTEIAATFGGSVETGASGALVLVVPESDVMKVLNSVRELAVRDTFKFETREVDLTEAIRNLSAHREFLVKDLSAGDESVRSQLEAIDDVLARYYEQVEHLTLEIRAKQPAN